MSKQSDRRDIDSGWAWIVLIAVYVASTIIATSVYMGGVMYTALLEQYGGDKAISSLIGSLNSGLLCLLGPFVSVFINIFSCRVSIVTGGLLVSFAYLTSAFVDSVNWLIFTFGILGGIGNCFAVMPMVVVLGYYFEKRRNTFVCIYSVVVGMGMFLSSPLSLALLETYGLHGAFLILSGLNAQVCVCGMICWPNSVEIRIYKNSKQDQQDSEGMDLTKHSVVKDFVRKMVSRFNFAILRDQVFTTFMCSTFTWNLMLSVFLMHLPNYMVTQGASTVDITVIMTCFSVGNTAGRLSSTFIVDRKSINNFTIHIGTLSLAGILTIAFPFFSFVNILKYPFAAVCGILTGIPNSLAAAVVLKIVGVEMFSAGHGLEFFFSGFGFIIGPPIAGFLLSQTNTYESSFYFAGVVVVSGAVLGAISSVLFQRSSKRKHEPSTRLMLYQERKELRIQEPNMEDENPSWQLLVDK